MDSAKQCLQNGGYTCVILRGDQIFTSHLRGVLPLLNCLDSGMDWSGGTAADKVVGKAAAFLYCLLGVKNVWASVISQPALEVLQSRGVNVQYEVPVGAICNRAGTGLCPMETATMNIDDPEQALIAIRDTLRRLQEGKKMNKKPVLVVMAAGMGSRYGGLKQIDPVGPCGEAILDYSLFDAYQAGFETAVIIIKEAIRKDFMETVGKRLEKSPVEIRYAYQEVTKVPENFQIPPERAKPWGTSHAVLCARDAIDGAPFAVINADDYYGKTAFRAIYDQLCHAEEGDYCMVGYELGKTVTENGSVARGVCQVSDEGYLQSVVERTRIETYEGGIHFTEDDGATWTELSFDVPVSMNMWGLTPDFLDALDAGFPEFWTKKVSENPLKAEYLLPVSVSKQVEAGKATVKVLRSADKWYGVTYAADKPQVVAALQALTNEGKYPSAGLWNN